MDRVLSTGKPVILVSNTGSAMDYSNEDEKCSAILQSWYSGQAGGKALAEVIFGDACPSAKLPVTFYKDGTQPPIEDYSMKGRTYRYLKTAPLYPFGYGLSYSDFEYSDVKFNSGDEFNVEVTVKNTGKVKAVEIAELYIDNMVQDKLSNGKNSDIADLPKLLLEDDQPYVSLAGFETITLEPGESGKVVFKLSDNAFDTVLEDGSRVQLKGSYKIYVGGQQPDARSEELTGKKCLETVVEI